MLFIVAGNVRTTKSKVIATTITFALDFLLLLLVVAVRLFFCRAVKKIIKAAFVATRTAYGM